MYFISQIYKIIVNNCSNLFLQKFSIIINCIVVKPSKNLQLDRKFLHNCCSIAISIWNHWDIYRSFLMSSGFYQYVYSQSRNFSYFLRDQYSNFHHFYNAKFHIFHPFHNKHSHLLGMDFGGIFH